MAFRKLRGRFKRFRQRFRHRRNAFASRGEEAYYGRPHSTARGTMRRSRRRKAAYTAGIFGIPILVIVAAAAFLITPIRTKILSIFQK